MGKKDKKSKIIKESIIKLYEQITKGKNSMLPALLIFKTEPTAHKSPKSNPKADKIKYRRKNLDGI